jgi:murein L,D-transpeptidase YcbB/YkuD
MKKIFFTGTVLCMVFLACKHHETPVKKTYTCNTAINAANACNNLFFDSTALEKYITQHNVQDSAADILRSFYYGRNFEFAWFTKYAVTEQCRQFWSLLSYNTASLKDSAAYDTALSKRMPDLTAEDSLWANGRSSFYVDLELRLTHALICTLQNEGNRVTPELLQKFLPPQKTQVMETAENLIADSTAGTADKDADLAYARLKTELVKYYTAAKKGGWQKIPYSGKRLKPGDNAPNIPLLRLRLAATVEYSGADTSSPVYDSALIPAVKQVEKTFGYEPDGVLYDSLLKDLSVAAINRVEQLVVNMQRIKWMPQMAGGRFINANIPEYLLHVYEARKKAFDMNVVVGKQGSATVTFTGSLTEIVFSPYWNIPPSIVKKEILPGMQDDADYLAKKHMEIKGYKNGLPVVRQLPGEGNSLGRVKFLFNNSYNIYFHDTPAKDLFSRRKRAYSHGCIRLADPVKMAAYLLDDNKEWTADKIAHAMDSTKETYVPLKKKVPVIISYYTAWPDEDGRLNLRDDVYGHDQESEEQLFTKP